MFGSIAVVLEHEMNVTIPLDRSADCGCHLVEPVGFRYRVHGVEAQPVEAILHQPIERVFGEETTHVRHAKVDCRAPRCLDVVAKEFRSVACEVVSIGPEVIVNDIEKDHEAVSVRGIDEYFQFVRRTVGAVRREGQHTVVTPVASAGEIIDRHQLERRDTEIREPPKLPNNAGKAAEQARVQFVQHGLFPRPAAPVAIAPPIGPWIDDQARAVHVVDLRARRRIGHSEPVLQAVTVGSASATGRLRLEPAIGQLMHRNKRMPSYFERDLLLRWCPELKVGVVLVDQICPKGERAREARHEGASTALLVSTALRATTVISSPEMSLSSFSGAALSMSRRVVTFRVGSRNTRSFSLGLRNRVRIATEPSSSLPARRTANRRFCGSFHDSDEMISPCVSNQAISGMPGAGSSLPCRKWRERRTGFSCLSRISRATYEASASPCTDCACAQSSHEISLSWQYALLLPRCVRPNSSPASSIGVPCEKKTVARSPRCTRVRISLMFASSIGPSAPQLAE